MAKTNHQTLFCCLLQINRFISSNNRAFPIHDLIRLFLLSRHARTAQFELRAKQNTKDNTVQLVISQNPVLPKCLPVQFRKNERTRLTNLVSLSDSSPRPLVSAACTSCIPPKTPQSLGRSEDDGGRPAGWCHSVSVAARPTGRLSRRFSGLLLYIRCFQDLICFLHGQKQVLALHAKNNRLMKTTYLLGMWPSSLIALRHHASMTMRTNLANSCGVRAHCAGAIQVLCGCQGHGCVAC